MKQPIKSKSPEAIMKANLAKTLGRMKTKVADREDLWLEIFTQTVQTLLMMEEEGEFRRKRVYGADNVMVMIDHAEIVANTMLDRYESRWGKG